LFDLPQTCCHAFDPALAYSGDSGCHPVGEALRFIVFKRKNA
jgi:hypothetical protein